MAALKRTLTPTLTPTLTLGFPLPLPLTPPLTLIRWSLRPTACVTCGVRSASASTQSVASPSRRRASGPRRRAGRAELGVHIIIHMLTFMRSRAGQGGGSSLQMHHTLHIAVQRARLYTC